jgi:hypothetical protein
MIPIAYVPLNAYPENLQCPDVVMEYVQGRETSGAKGLVQQPPPPLPLHDTLAWVDSLLLLS